MVSVSVFYVWPRDARGPDTPDLNSELKRVGVTGLCLGVLLQSRVSQAHAPFGAGQL